MNHDTTPTPRTDSIISAIDMDAAYQDLSRELELELAEKDNEVARLEEELKERIETQSTFALALLEKPEREVEKLRELLERAIEAIEEEGCPKTANDIREELARLAPSPEEPVIQDSRITEPAETCPSQKDTSTETCPSQKDAQWRELGFGTTQPTHQ